MNNRPTESEKSDVIYQALAMARDDMEDIRKECVNSFHKNKYASLPAFINATDEALKKHGLLLTNHIIGEYEKPFLCVHLRHILTGQWIKSYVPLTNTKGDCQGLGSAITYMRRYAMGALFNLCPENDDDGNKACKDVPDDKKKNNSVPVAQPQPQQNPNNQPMAQQQAAPPAQEPPQIDQFAIGQFMQRHYTNDQLGANKKGYVLAIAERSRKTEFEVIMSAIKNEGKFLEQFALWSTPQARKS